MSYPIETSIDSAFELKIQMGKVPGYEITHKFGYTETADTNLKDIWTFNFDKTYAASGVPMYIWSTAADTTEITVYGLDENWERVTAVVTLNGTTPVQIPGLWTRIYRARNLTPPPFTGNVYISRTVTAAPGVPLQADAEAHLLALTQGTVMTQFTVPAGYTAYVYRFDVGTTKGKDIRAYGFHRLNGGAFKAEEVMTSFESSPSKILPFLSFPEKSDFVIKALSDVTNTFIYATYDLVLIQNNPQLV